MAGKWGKILLAKFGHAMLQNRCMSKRGQAITEFVIVAGILLASVAIMTLLVLTFQEYGSRILDLVGSEYP